MKQFYTRILNKAVLVDGYDLTEDFFVYKNDNSWFVIDKKTGASVAKNFTKKQVISDFNSPSRQEAIAKVRSGENYKKMEEDFNVFIQEATKAD